MSLNLEKNKARMTVMGYGWNDSVTDSGDGTTEDGLALEDFCDDLGYDFGDNFDWDSLAQDLDINLDLDGNIDLSQQESLSEDLANLADNEDAINSYLADNSLSTGVPARIRVINPPDKTVYEAGETIDYTGIVVAAYASLTTRAPFIMEGASGPHQNQIPFDELTFPVMTIGKSGQSEGELPKYKWIPHGDCSPSGMLEEAACTDVSEDSEGIDRSYIKRRTTYGKWGVYRREGSEWYTYVFAAKYGTENIIYVIGSYEDKTGAGNDHTYSYLTQRLKKQYFKYFIYGEFGATPNFVPQGVQVLSSLTEVLDAMWDGKWEPEPETISIPVQWQTDYQIEPYEASVDITVI